MQGSDPSSSSLRAEAPQPHRRRLSLSSSDRLRGRDAEIRTLHGAWDKILEAAAPTQVVLIHGNSGSGKTALCRQLQRKIQVHNRNSNSNRNSNNAKAAAADDGNNSNNSCGFFASGKFDQYQDFSAPYSAIVQAFDGLGRAVAERRKNTSRAPEDPWETPPAVKDCLENVGSILLELVPSLRSLLEEKEDGGDDSDVRPTAPSNSNAVASASERLAVALQSFLEAFCAPTRPLAVFIDDLQWVDTNSAKVLSTLAVDPEIRNFVIVVGYRNEEASNEGVQSFGKALAHVRSSNVTDICVSDLHLESLNGWLAQEMRCDLEYSLPLSKAVLRKTHGNPLFVVQFLEMLQRRDLLNFSITESRWTWSMDRIIGETNVSDNVVVMISRQVQSVPRPVRRVLILAACLGFLFHAELLESLSSSSIETDDEDPAFWAQKETNDTGRAGSSDGRNEESKNATLPGPGVGSSSSSYGDVDAIQRALGEGLLERQGTGNLIKWSHDRFQQGAYSLLHEEKARALVHLRIGMHIREAFAKKASDQHIFLAADQLNRGSALIETDEARRSLILLNLEACLAAKRKSAVELAASFLREAIRLSCDEDWQLIHESLMEVHTLSAEIEFSLGRFDASERSIEVVLARIRHPEEATRVRIVNAQRHGAQRLFANAIRESRLALSELGVRLPMSLTFNLILELLKTKRAVANKSDSFFDNLPPMTDPKRMWAMRILQAASVYGWNSDNVFAGICYLRMMRITISHGRCETTPYALAGYGFMVSSFGGIDKGFRFGQLAQQQIRSKESLPSTTIMCEGFLSHLRLPTALSQDKLLHGYRVGLEKGDMINGGICMTLYAILVPLVCGLPLRPYLRDMKSFSRQLRICKQSIALVYAAPCILMAMNLTGETKSPVSVSWRDCIDLGILDVGVHVDNISPAFLTLCYVQLFIAYVLGDEESAARSKSTIASLSKKRYSGFHFVNYGFAALDGLVHVWFQRKKSTRKNRRAISVAIAELVGYAKKGSLNCLGLLRLLEAEHASLTRGTSEVRKMFDEPISQLVRSGLTHYGAIANERAGEYMLSRDDQFWAEHYLSKSIELYSEWGASVKVEKLLGLYDFVKLGESNIAGRYLRGREQFNSAVDVYENKHSSIMKAELSKKSSIRSKSARLSPGLN